MQMPNEITKSYVPGKGFVPASKLGATKLKRALGAGDGERKFIAGKDGVRVQTKPTKPKTNPYKSRGLDQTQRRALEAHQGNTANFRLFAEHGRPIKSSKGVDAYRVPGLQQATGSHAMAWKTGGKKGKRIYAEDADAKATMTPKQHKQLRQHEESHTAPKSRTSWRLARVASDPKKIMREEARADMAGGTYYRRMRPDARRVDRLERRVEKNPSAFLNASDKDMRALNRITGESGYAQMASSGLARRRSTNQLTALSSGSSRAAQELAEQKFSARSLREYRKTQNKIARAQGVRKALHMPNEVSKMSPDPSAVHVPGNARLVRRRNKDRKPKRPTSGM